MSERQSLAGRLLRWSLWLVFAVVAVYLIGGNVILNTELLSPVINRKPEKTLVEWKSGRTLFPGRIHVEGLRVRGQSKGQQWEFEVEEADVKMSLLALARKAIRIRQARGTGFDFRMRPRLTEETKDDPAAADFPEIAGLSNPPDPAPEDIYPKKKKTKPGWHLDIADMRFEGPMLLWIGGARMSGTGRVAGDLDFLIRRDFHLPRAVFDLDDGVIAFGAEPFVSDLDITADVTLGPFPPKEVKGMAVLDHLLGTFRLDSGEIQDLTVLNTYVPGTGTLELTQGQASFSWAFEKISAEEGSTGVLDIAAKGADMLFAGREVGGDITLHTNLVRGSLAEGRWVVAETTLALDNVLLDVIEADPKAAAEVGEPDLWWGHFKIHAGSVDMDEPGELDVTASFALKNTEPMLEVFLAKPTEGGDTAKVPKWVRFIPDIENLGGNATVRMGADGAIVDDVVVQGDKFDLLGRLQTQGKETSGILYVRYKGLDIGLDMQDGKSDLKILRPKKWFLEQLEPDDEAMRAAIEQPQ